MVCGTKTAPGRVVLIARCVYRTVCELVTARHSLGSFAALAVHRGWSSVLPTP